MPKKLLGRKHKTGTGNNKGAIASRAISKAKVIPPISTVEQAKSNSQVRCLLARNSVAERRLHARMTFHMHMQASIAAGDGSLTKPLQAAQQATPTGYSETESTEDAEAVVYATVKYMVARVIAEDRVAREQEHCLRAHRAGAMACTQAGDREWARQRKGSWAEIVRERSYDTEPFWEARWMAVKAWQREFPQDNCVTCERHMSNCLCVTKCSTCGSKEVPAHPWICKPRFSWSCMCDVRAAHRGRLPWCTQCMEAPGPRPGCPVGCKVDPRNLASSMAAWLTRGL